MARLGELRRHGRDQQLGNVDVTWITPEGIPTFARGRCVDLSESGMGIESSERIEKGLYLQFNLRSQKFQGSASVRYCKRSGMRYQIGLEFSSGTRWKGDVSA